MNWRTLITLNLNDYIGKNILDNFPFPYKQKDCVFHVKIYCGLAPI